MVSLLRGRQFARGFHTTARVMEDVVLTVEQRSHATGEGAIKLWKNISFKIGLSAIALATLNVYLRHKEEGAHHEQPEFIPLPYLKILNKRFPWGDGKHTLFHNPKRNYVPGIGWEE